METEAQARACELVPEIKQNGKARHGQGQGLNLGREQGERSVCAESSWSLQ